MPNFVVTEDEKQPISLHLAVESLEEHRVTESINEEGEEEHERRRPVSRAGSKDSKESNSSSSVTFSVKRSALASKNLDAPSPFQPDDGEHTAEDITSPPVSQRVSDSECPQKKCKYETSPEKLCQDSSHETKTKKIRRKSNHSHSHGPVIDTVKSTASSNEPIRESSGKSHSEPKSNSKNASVIASPRSSHSATLVAYNSSDEATGEQEKPAPDRKSSKHHRKRSKTTKCEEKQTNEKDSVTLSATALSSEVKVVKPPAKSTWDSSDSDFEIASAVGDKPSTVESVGNKPLTDTPVDNKPSTTTPVDNKPSTATPVESHKSTSVSRKEPLDKATTEDRLKSSIPEHSEDDHDSRSNKNGTKTTSSHRTQRRSKRSDSKHRSPYSSRSSSGSHAVSSTRAAETTRDGDVSASSSKQQQRRSRSHSSVSPSSRSSRNASEYSSGSSHSSGWRYLNRRKRSKSYTSHSSSRDSSNYSSRYRDRSKSRSRSDRHRRHRVRSSYRRRRYRRHSFSRSRSHSWRTSDSSSRASSRSSRSRTSSRISRHRSSTNHRSPSSHSTLIHPKSAKTEHGHSSSPSANKDTQPLVASHGRRTKPTESSKSNYADTISAAVKMVIGGGKLLNKNNYPETTQPISTVLVPSVQTTTTSGGLVDIPLPRDVAEAGYTRELHELPTRSEPAPYIGPQLPPELAKRYGLSVDEPNTSAVDSCDKVLTPSAANTTTQSPKNTAPVIVTSSSPSEFLIPPEKVEHYRALQEQAKQHALLRNLYASADSVSSNSLPTTAVPLSHVVSHAPDAHTQQQQLQLQQQHQQQQFALMQHLSRESNLLSSASIVHPSYPTAVASNFASGGNMLVSGTAADTMLAQQLAQLPEEARLRSLSALIGMQTNQVPNQLQQHLLASMTGLTASNAANKVAVGSEQLSSIMSPMRTSGLDLSTLPPSWAAQLQQQVQSSQTQQWLSTVAALQAANANKNMQSHQLQAAYAAQVLAAQQAQRMATLNVSSDALIAARNEALRKQALDLQKNSANEQRLLQLGNITDLSHSAIGVAPGLQNAAAWSASLARNRTGTVLPVQDAAAQQQQQQHASLVAFLTAVQQQQQQQQQLYTASLRPPITLQQTVPVVTSTESFMNPVILPQQLMAQSNVMLSAQQQQHLQQQLILKAMQQRQQQLIPTTSSAATNDQALFYAQVMAMQQKQQHQQALATSAILAARAQQQQQQQQQAHDRSGKPI